MYHIVCECGRYTQTQDLEGYCPQCKRPFLIRWSDARTMRERFYALFGDWAKTPHINCPCWETGEFIQVPCPWHDGKDKFPKGAYEKSLQEEKK